jgi:trans-aconitate methyltransferase
LAVLAYVRRAILPSCWLAMGIVGRQFGRPAGLLGRIVGGLMARGNGPFNTALVAKLHELHSGAARIADVGCGPGVGLAALLAQFPQAQVVGTDLSPQMLAQSRKRNSGAIDAGRLELREGDVTSISPPVDLVTAVHVLYFWHDPTSVLAQLRNVLTPNGVLALGYRCRQDMPQAAQKDFPREGHRLYDNEEAVRELLTTAGFRSPHSHSIDSAGNHLGWLTVASA